jgi:hypothetical protein
LPGVGETSHTCGFSAAPPFARIWSQDDKLIFAAASGEHIAHDKCNEAAGRDWRRKETTMTYRASRKQARRFWGAMAVIRRSSRWLDTRSQTRTSSDVDHRAAFTK